MTIFIKQEKTGGSWQAMVKQTLIFQSKIKTIISLSTRNVIEKDDATLEQTLFGLCLISPHRDISVSPPVEHRMYGYYTTDIEGDILPLSVTEPTDSFLEDFKKEIGTNRKIAKETKVYRY